MWTGKWSENIHRNNINKREFHKNEKAINIFPENRYSWLRDVLAIISAYFNDSGILLIQTSGRCRA